MTVGERIKHIRKFRNITQAELGQMLGFEGKSQAIRITQYETNYRVPKQDMIMDIARILECNYKALSNYDSGSAEDIMEMLFWLEENGHANTIKLFEPTPVQTESDMKMTYNENTFHSSSAPVALAFDYGLMNDFLLEWSRKKKELTDGRITAAEYFEWKIQWPK